MTKHHTENILVSDKLPLDIQLLSSKQAAKALAMGTKKLQKIRENGKISYVPMDDEDDNKVKIRKKICKYCYRASAVKEFIDEREVKAKTCVD